MGLAHLAPCYCAHLRAAKCAKPIRDCLPGTLTHTHIRDVHLLDTKLCRHNGVHAGLNLSSCAACAVCCTVLPVFVAAFPSSPTLTTDCIDYALTKSHTGISEPMQVGVGSWLVVGSWRFIKLHMFECEQNVWQYSRVLCRVTAVC